jgi:hypothetical protein
MPAPDSTYSTLTNIQTKIRRITRSPSTSQLTNAEINNYINTFILYDFPEHLRLFDLRTTFKFYTSPNIDTYSTNTTDPDNPLYNFNNKYTTIHNPIYVAGYQVFYTQSREQFYGIYPNLSNIASIGATGDGITTNFVGTIANIPFLKNNVVFSSVNTNGEGLVLVDNPLFPPFPVNTGVLTVPDSTGPLYGTINYITGAFDITFPSAPAAGATINSQVISYVASRPLAMLYYADQFILRPVPDQPYEVNMECYMRPTELLNASDEPQIAQWWEYIAYGACRKIFQDRMDLDSLQLIEPEFRRQQNLVLRKTLIQMSNERTSTIYTEQTSLGFGGGFGWGGGGLF